MYTSNTAAINEIDAKPGLYKKNCNEKSKEGLQTELKKIKKKKKKFRVKRAK